MKIPKLRLLFFGSDTFSVTVLRYLLTREICPIQVVTKNNSSLGRFSSKNKLETHDWPLSYTVNNNLLSNIGLVASFGHLIDVNTVNQFNYGLFNIHPSLLPQYRGSTPIQAAIKDGIPETGCTVMRIPPVAKFDIGDIILQERMSIKPGEYALELRDRLAHLGATMFERLLLNYEETILDARPQGTYGRSYAKKLKLEDGKINFNTESSEHIYRKVRAYLGFIELYSYCLKGLKIRLAGMRRPDEVESYDLDRLTLDLLKTKNVIEGTVYPGTIYFHKLRQLVCIKCSDRKWVAFKFVTPVFKNTMSALDFHNGFLSKVDVRDRRIDDQIKFS